MKKSVCQIFNKNCLETGLKPDIPTINAAALEYVKRFPLFNVLPLLFRTTILMRPLPPTFPIPS